MQRLKSFFFSFALVLPLLSAGYSQAQTKVFSEARCVPPSTTRIYDCEKWAFSIGEDKYEIDKSGRGKRIRKPSYVNTFRFGIDDAEFVDRVIYFAEYQNDLLLIGELSFDDAGGGFIIRLFGNTLGTKWRTSIPSFNVAQGLIEANSAYLAGTGFISKIDLGTGKYIWKHEDLYRKYDESGAFNVFLTPLIEGDSVIFREDDILNRGFDHQIRVNKSDGKIIQVILN